MHLTVRAIVLGVVAFLFATPLMACAMETASITVSEAECCRQMNGDCHTQIGPASHKCCRTFAGSPDAATSQKVAAAGQVDLIAMVPAPATLAPIATAMPVAVADTSPPGSPPICNAILRI